LRTSTGTEIGACLTLEGNAHTDARSTRRRWTRYNVGQVRVLNTQDTHQDTQNTRQDTQDSHKDTHQDTQDTHQDTQDTHQDTEDTHQDTQDTHQDTQVLVLFKPPAARFTRAYSACSVSAFVPGLI